jgi:hypothetical protein
MKRKLICDFRTNILAQYIALIPSKFTGPIALIRVKFILKPKIKTEGVEIKFNFLFDLGSKWLCVVNVAPRLLYPRESQVPIV